jgi:hypothetical protein
LHAAFCATKARSDRTEHFMKYLMLFALLFVPIPQAHAAQSAQQCLDRIAQFQAYAKKQGTERTSSKRNICLRGFCNINDH